MITTGVPFQHFYIFLRKIRPGKEIQRLRGSFITTKIRVVGDPVRSRRVRKIINKKPKKVPTIDNKHPPNDTILEYETWSLHM